MSLGAREARILARIEAGLSGSDPALAARFDRFNKLAERPRWQPAARPIMEPVGAGRGLRWCRNRTANGFVTLGFLLAAMLLIALLPLGHGGSSGCGQSVITCPSTRACAGLSPVRAPVAHRPDCRSRMPPNVP